MKKHFIIMLTIILVLGFLIGLIYLAKYARQITWEDFTKMHDYINNRNIGE